MKPLKAAPCSSNRDLKELRRSPFRRHQQAALPLSAAAAPPSTKNRKRCAQHGDIVTIDLELTPEGDFVPERLFDTNGTISFILGWGNYLPAIHELIEGMRIGEQVDSISVDAGWGEHRADMVIAVPKSSFKNLNLVIWV